MTSFIYDEPEAAPASPAPAPPVRDRYAPLKALMIVITIGIVILYFTGRMDPMLSNVGLNLHPCVTNGFGATFCGQDAKNYCGNLDSIGINQLNTTSADVCASIESK